MAPPFAALDMTTQSPRTSLIDAEWEWLARRADANDASDGVAFTDRDTAPGLAPFSQPSAASTPAPWSLPPDTTPPQATDGWRSLRVELAFVAAILVSFAVGVVALPVGKSVVSRLQQDLWTDGYTAQLDFEHATPNSAPVVAPVRPVAAAPQPAAPQPESVVAAPTQPAAQATPTEAAVAPEVPVNTTKTKTARASAKPAASRRWSPPPRWVPPPRRPSSDNPY